MNTTTLLWVIAVSGAGTFLVRLLPMWWHARRKSGAGKQGAGRRALDAIGPAAIVSLLTVSLWGLVSQGGTSWQSIITVLAGLAGVWAGHRYLHSIAWATLAGVCAYGAMLKLLAGA